MTQLTAFITAVLALSVAAERVVEMIKGYLPNFWLFLPSPNPTTEARRCAALRTLSGIVGGISSYVSHIDLFTYIHPNSKPADPHWHDIGSFLLAALMTSAGSAFWNHTFDILKATKVQQEQEAITAQNANQSGTKALA